MTAPSAFETGTILDVEQVTLGSELDGDLTSGSTSLTIIDGSDFDADSGGTCSINGDQYDYTVVDVDNGLLTITPGLTAAGADGDRVDVWDTTTGTAASYFEVLVQLPGDEDVDATPARLASPLVPQFTHKLGVRDSGVGEVCTMQLQGDEWVVIEAPGDTVQVDGSLLVSGSVIADSVVTGALDAYSINAASLSAVTMSGHVVGSTLSGSDVDVDGDGGRVLLYSQIPTVITETASGTGTFTVPAGVTSAKIEAWGAGSAGSDGSIFGAPGTLRFGAGGGGEYACEPQYMVTPGQTFTWTVGNGGSVPSGPGGDSVVVDNTTGLPAVTAHGGASRTVGAAGAGGSGSDASIHFDGGSGSPGNSSGGGSSGGRKAVGANGSGAGNVTGGNAPTGGGDGGDGATTGAAGTSGQAPGGGGGSGALSGHTSGTAGADGQVRITYYTTELVGSISGVAGTDDFGNTVAAGMRSYNTAFGMIGGYYRHGTFSVAVPDSATTAVGGVASVKLLSDFGVCFTGGAFIVPADGVYTFYLAVDALGTTSSRGELSITQNASYIAYGGRWNIANNLATVTAPNIWCVAGDVITFNIWQNSGGTVTYTGLLTVKKEA